VIIWSRWGFLVVLIALAGMGFGGLLSAVFASVGGLQPVFFGVGLLLAGAGIWAFDQYVLPKMDKPRPVLVMSPPTVDQWGRPVPGRPVQAVNPQTGQPLFRRTQSTLFFIPFGIWTWVVGGVGALLLVAGAVSSLVA
jgi:hypothetical protein